jgi:hypothetical protein
MREFSSLASFAKTPAGSYRGKKRDFARLERLF